MYKPNLDHWKKLLLVKNGEEMWRQALEGIEVVWYRYTGEFNKYIQSTEKITLAHLLYAKYFAENARSPLPVKSNIVRKIRGDMETRQGDNQLQEEGIENLTELYEHVNRVANRELQNAFQRILASPEYASWLENLKQYYQTRTVLNELE
jgi:hypothetical protein